MEDYRKWAKKENAEMSNVKDGNRKEPQSNKIFPKERNAIDQFLK